MLENFGTDNKRGDKELVCLAAIRDSVFNISSSRTKRNVYFFGMSKNDSSLFKNALKETTPNPNPSSFPDFVFENGFIEHFEITSSSSNRKGYLQKREHSIFEKQAKKSEELLKKQINENPDFSEIKSTTSVFRYPNCHSYENLEKSFTAKWDKHIKSLSKYNGQKDVGIFLVDYQEAGVFFTTDLSFLSSETRYGDLLPHIEDHLYRLSRDSNLLNFIYKYKDKIKYVIFRNFKRIEVISVVAIPELLKLLPFKYIYKGNDSALELKSVYTINTPM